MKFREGFAGGEKEGYKWAVITSKSLIEIAWRKENFSESAKICGKEIKKFTFYLVPKKIKANEKWLNKY